MSYARDPNCTLFIGGIDDMVDEYELRRHFETWGTIVHVKLLYGKKCGFVQYARRQDAEKALQHMHGAIIGRYPIRVSWRNKQAETPTQTPYTQQSSHQYTSGTSDHQRGYYHNDNYLMYQQQQQPQQQMYQTTTSHVYSTIQPHHETRMVEKQVPQDGTTTALYPPPTIESKKRKYDIPKNGYPSSKRLKEEDDEERLLRRLRDAERDLIEQYEKVVQLRRKIRWKKVPDYKLLEGDKDLSKNQPSSFTSVLLSQLFEGKDTLIVYHYIGSQTCYLWLDVVASMLHWLTDKITFIAVCQKPLQEMREIAKSRRWYFNVVSCENTTFNRDFYVDDGKNLVPAFTVFKKKDGVVYHTYSSASKYHTVIDCYNVLFNLLDMTPDGRERYLFK